MADQLPVLTKWLSEHVTAFPTPWKVTMDSAKAPRTSWFFVGFSLFIVGVNLIFM